MTQINAGMAAALAGTTGGCNGMTPGMAAALDVSNSGIYHSALAAVAASTATTAGGDASPAVATGTNDKVKARSVQAGEDLVATAGGVATGQSATATAAAIAASDNPAVAQLARDATAAISPDTTGVHAHPATEQLSDDKVAAGVASVVAHSTGYSSAIAGAPGLRPGAEYDFTVFNTFQADGIGTAEHPYDLSWLMGLYGPVTDIICTNSYVTGIAGLPPLGIVEVFGGDFYGVGINFSGSTLLAADVNILLVAYLAFATNHLPCYGADLSGARAAYPTGDNGDDTSGYGAALELVYYGLVTLTSVDLTAAGLTATIGNVYTSAGIVPGATLDGALRITQVDAATTGTVVLTAGDVTAILADVVTTGLSAYGYAGTVAISDGRTLQYTITAGGAIPS